MKKLYILLISIIVCSVANAQTTDTKPTFIITNLGVPSGDEGTVYTETKYDASIEIKFRNVTQRTWDNIFYPNCLEEPLYDMKYVEMVNANTVAATANDHSFIEIKSTGEAHIEKIEFVAGAAAKDAKLICAPSIDGEDYLNRYVYVGTTTAIRKNITFPAPLDGEIQVCGASFFYEVPVSTEYDSRFGSGPSYPDFRNDAKYIRLNWSSRAFAGVSGAKGDPVNIFALKIYTNANTTGTGIENESHEKFDVKLIGEKLSVSEVADLNLFSVQGKLVLSVKNTDEVNLSDLPKGLYIIKAQATDSKQTVVKKIIL